MDSKLLNAAIEGSVELLRQDNLVLQRYMAERLKQTPLHIAAMKGHLEFTKEVLENMPEMRFAKDCEGRNPLHMAVIKGHIDILKELLQFKPDDAEFVNSKDEKGSSILHLAVAEKQIEVVKYLLQEDGKVDVNARNADGFTAWDISLALARRDSKAREVAECLQKAQGKTKCCDFFKNLCFPTAKEDPREKKKLEESCNALMIAASIITTLTYQALIQPPENFKEVQQLNRCNKTQTPVKHSGEYALYMFFNTLSFSATVGVLLLLISGFPLKHRTLIWILRITMWIAVLSAAFVIFIVADAVFWHKNTHIYAADIVAWVMVILTIILTVGHAIRIIIKTVRCLRKPREDRIPRANLNPQDQGHV